MRAAGSGDATDERDEPTAGTLRAADDDAQRLQEAKSAYESRRCHVCHSPHAPFGFGPPMTKPGIMLWACKEHRTAVELQLLPPQSAPINEKNQLTLF
jgi:hypothetical protein